MDVMEKVKTHHEYIENMGFHVVMTVLIGSQNYELAVPESDIDTFTFILPSFRELALGENPKSGEYEVEDGKCMYKDIRLALNLLKKTSPNSVEYFVGRFRIFNSKYETILKSYLCDDVQLNAMVHCNHFHMLYAMAGMAHQLTKRNMPAGKRYSHALRLRSMADIFTSSLEARYLLELLPRDYEEALEAKHCNEKRLEQYYNAGCDYIAERLNTIRENFKLSNYLKHVEEKGMEYIENLQKELMYTYLNNKLKEEI